MPHVVLEYSQGVEDSCDMQTLCEDLFQALATQETFEASAIKVRTTSAAFFRIGTEPQSFVHATLMLMDGRDEPTRRALNACVLDVLAKSLPGVGSLTVQDVEMCRATYAKRVL